ncbi:MAG: ABC transporter ATP-binding protein, partial [Patescibacteria group bacterium]
MSKKLTYSQLKVTFRVILDFFYRYRRDLLILFFIDAILSLGNGAVPYLTGKLFDFILAPSELFTLSILTMPRVLWLLVLLAVIQSIIAIVSYYTHMKESVIEFYSRFDYINLAYAKLLELPLSFHKTHKIGDLTSKINMAGWGLQSIIGRLITSLGAEFLTVLVSIGVIFYIEPYIAIFSVIGLCLFIFIASFSVRSAAGLEDKFSDAWGKAFGLAGDAVTNVSAVKQSTAETYEQIRIKRGFIRNLLPLWLKEDGIWASLSFQQRFVIIALQLIIFAWSIRLVTTGAMTIGELIAFNSYLSMLFGPFVNLLNMSKTIQSGIVNINAVERMLAVHSEDYRPINEIVVNKISGDIEFSNVSFSYHKNQPILAGLDFKVKAGQVIALVGESGVGKSTMIDLLSGYHFPTKGKVMIDQIDIRNLNLHLLRSHIAIVPQEVVLFNDTIQKNIKYGNFQATDEEIKVASRKAHALDFIEKFPKKWKQLVGERGVKLSVGQKQRVAIARAILRNQAILILDEPTSALDAKSEKIIQESLNELMSGRTTFIVAHRLSTVRKADLILVFEEGRIVERGTHDELLQIEKGKYRHLYEL